MAGCAAGLLIAPPDVLQDGAHGLALLAARQVLLLLVLVTAWRRWVSQRVLERMAFGALIGVAAVRLPTLLRRSDELIAFDVALSLLILSGVVTFVFRRRVAIAWIIGLAAVNLGSAWLVLHDGDPALRVELVRLTIFAVLVMLALQVDRRALAHESRLAREDPLTGVLNRRALGPALEDAAAGPDRATIVLFDLDRFKAINDEEGHAAGDEILQRVAEAASSVMRDGDLLARWGGEEFLVLLPGTDAEQGTEVAERVRRSLLADAGVTASFGVAERRDGDPVARWVSRADRAMYAAKHLGRDRVEQAR